MINDEDDARSLSLPSHLVDHVNMFLDRWDEWIFVCTENLINPHNLYAGPCIIWQLFVMTDLVTSFVLSQAQLLEFPEEWSCSRLWLLSLKLCKILSYPYRWCQVARHFMVGWPEREPHCHTLLLVIITWLRSHHLILNIFPSDYLSPRWEWFYGSLDMVSPTWSTEFISLTSTIFPYAIWPCIWVLRCMCTLQLCTILTCLFVGSSGERQMPTFEVASGGAGVAGQSEHAAWWPRSCAQRNGGVFEYIVKRD